MTEHVLKISEDHRGVARLTLNRPEVRNAFNEQLISSICDTMGRLSNDPKIRVIVITGEGSAFSAGADLNMMRQAADYSPSENKDDARRLAHMLRAIDECSKPTIALVNGPTIGGGVGIAAASDIVIASEDAFFALTEVRVGLIPAVISPFVVRAIGPRQARRFFLTGERIKAEPAKQIGLAHMISMPAQLEATLNGIVDSLLLGGPTALSNAKSLVKQVVYQDPSKGVSEETVNLIARTRASKEGREGLTAFLEKRKPNWIQT